MNAEALKTRIKKKFGTLSQFAKATHKDRYELQKYFASPLKYRNQLRSISKEVKDSRKVGKNNVPFDKIKALRDAIDREGGVYVFCKSEKGNNFRPQTLFQIIQGRRKRISPVMQVLFEMFNI